VETERGRAASCKGNYSDYLRQKLEREAQQFSAWEKWNKESQKQQDIVRRCAGLQRRRFASSGYLSVVSGAAVTVMVIAGPVCALSSTPSLFAAFVG
jgi:ABC transporter